MRTLLDNFLARFGYYRFPPTNVPLEKDYPSFEPKSAPAPKAAAKPKRKVAVKKTVARKTSTKK